MCPPPSLRCLSCDAVLNCKVSTLHVAQAPHQPHFEAPGLSDFRNLSTNFFPVDYNPPPHISNLPSTMSFLGSSSSKSNEDIKTALLQQVQQEQAMVNARALIGVRHSS